jgi:hypothetical protein
MSSCIEDMVWRRLAPARWPRLSREIAAVLVVKTLLLLIILKMNAPSTTVTVGIESHMLGMQPDAVTVERTR